MDNLLGRPQVVSLRSAEREAEAVSAELVKAGANSMCVNAPHPVPQGSTVRIDVDGGMVLGRVQRCTEAPGGRSVLSIEIEKVIPSLPDLARLMEAIRQAGAGMPASPQASNVLSRARQ
jgi:hypothetical protein